MRTKVTNFSSVENLTERDENESESALESESEPTMTLVEHFPLDTQDIEHPYEENEIILDAPDELESVHSKKNEFNVQNVEDEQPNFLDDSVKHISNSSKRSTDSSKGIFNNEQNVQTNTRWLLRR